MVFAHSYLMSTDMSWLVLAYIHVYVYSIIIYIHMHIYILAYMGHTGDVMVRGWPQRSISMERIHFIHFRPFQLSEDIYSMSEDGSFGP